MTSPMQEQMQVQVRGVATDEEIAAVLAALAGFIRPAGRTPNGRNSAGPRRNGRAGDNYERWRRTRIAALTR